VRENGEEKVRCHLCFVLVFHKVAVDVLNVVAKTLVQVNDRVGW
jgi:hypothetical protein